MLTQNGLNTDSYDAAISIKLFSMVVIGGLGSLPGAVLGAVYVRGAEFFLPPEWSLVASGLGILFLLLFLLSGLVYNVEPLRTKDRAYLDVATESHVARGAKKPATPPAKKAAPP